MGDVEQPRTATATTATAKSRKWTRLAILGLVMASLGPLLMFIAAVLWGLDVVSDAPFFLITAAIALLGAFLVGRFGTWAKFLGIVAALLVGMAMWWTAFGVFSPGSFFDFVPGILVLPGVIIAIVGCIAALVTARRADTEVATGGRGYQIILGVVLALVALSAVLTFAAQTTAEEGDADVTVVLSDFEFGEDEYSFAPGTTVLVRNDDPFLHTFTVEDLDIDVALTPGSSELVTIPDEPGEYVVFCQPHTSDSEDPDDEDMAARLTVE